MSAWSRPAASRSFRHSRLIAAIACALPAAAWAVRTDLPVPSAGTFIEALGEVAGPTCNPDGYRITATSPFTVSAATPLPTIGCANVEIVGGTNVTIVDASYGGLACGLNAAPVAGLTKVSGILVQGFDASGTSAGMCGKLDASANTVTGNSIGFSLAGGANIVGNTISANLSKGVNDSGSGSTVAQNVINSNSGYGVYAASGMVIDANTITNNTSSGIYGFDAMVVTNNTITGNGWEGVKVFDAATITGNLIASNGSGIDAGAGAVIKGNTVRDHMAGTGIDLYDGGTIGGTGAGEGNVVYNNYVDIYAYTGTTYGGPLEIVNNLVGTPDGAAPGTSYYGINVYYQASAYNIAGNVISSHTSGPGLRIRYATAAGTVSGNMVGVNASGTAALANQGAGIELHNLSAGVTVDNNVSSGNAGSGVNIYQALGVTLTNNKIGTNAPGTSGIGNGSAGLVVSCAGPLSVSGNVISSNAQYGGYLSGVTGSTFVGNFIGTAADGMSPLANAGPGISLNSTACGPSLRDPGLEPKAVKVAVQNVFDGNVVAHNNGDGFFIWGGAGNVIRGGSIHSNAGKNINLDFAAGPLPNDALDADTGPNMRQNHPVVDSVIQGGAATVVQYALASTPGSTFSLDFYANGTGGVPAGQTFLGQALSATTDGAGNAAGSITFAGAHEYVTATATGMDGTSELSLPMAALAASVAPTTLNFGTVPVGGASAPQTVTITSTSHAPYLISGMVTASTPPACPGSGISVCTSGDFTCATNCLAATPYGLGASCTVTATFQPMALGAGSTTLYICDNTSPTARAVPFSGNGIASQLGRLSLPSTIDFGATMLASNPLRHSLQLRNTGTQDVLLVLITATPPFAVAHDCPASLAPGATCVVDISFAPLYYGLSVGQLTVASNAQGGEATVTLIAMVSSVPYGVTPSEADFGPQLVGLRSPTRAFIIGNNGDSAISLTEVAVSGPFTLVTNTCETSLAPRSSCRAEVAFEPVRAGPATGSLTARVGLAGAPEATAQLTGSGIQQPVIVLPATIDFGSVVLGSAPSVARELELRNTGNAVLNFTASASAPFALSGTCGSTLAPGAACNLVLTFTPTAAGEFTGSLAIVSNAPGGSRSIGLIVRVTREMAPFIGLAPTFIGYGERIIGTLSAAQRVTVTNYGGSDAVIGAITAGVDFVVHSQCGPALAPQASCAVDVAMRPLRFGPRSSQLLVPSNAAGSPNVVELLGTGCRPFTMFSSRSGLRSSCSP